MANTDCTTAPRAIVTVVPKLNDGPVVECSACGVLDNPQSTHRTTRFASYPHADAFADRHRSEHRYNGGWRPTD